MGAAAATEEASTELDLPFFHLSFPLMSTHCGT